METFNKLMESMNGIVWGPPMMVLLLGVGLFLTVGMRFISILKIGYGFKQLFKKRTGEAEEGDVSPFAALMTALSSTVVLDVGHGHTRNSHKICRRCFSRALPRG